MLATNAPTSCDVLDIIRRGDVDALAWGHERLTRENARYGGGVEGEINRGITGMEQTLERVRQDVDAAKNKGIDESVAPEHEPARVTDQADIPEAPHVMSDAQFPAAKSGPSQRPAQSPLVSIKTITHKVLALQKARAALLLAGVRGDKGARSALAASMRRRMGARFVGLARRLPGARHAFGSVLSFPPHEASVSSYDEWCRRFDTPDQNVLNGLTATLGIVPPVLFVVRFSATSLHLAEQTVNALKASVGVNWVVHFIFDVGCDATRVRQIRASLTQDPRFVFDGTVPRDLGFAIFVEGGAIPRSHGAWIFAQAHAKSSDVVVVYSDEDMISEAGVSDPWFKPEFSPLLLDQNLLLGRVVGLDLRADLVGPFVADLFDPTADVGALIRKIAKKAGDRRVTHLPHVLFHNALPLLEPIPLALPELKEIPVASVLIPTRDGWHLLGPCLESLRLTEWPRDKLEILVIDNGSVDPITLNGMRDAEARGEIKVLRDGRPFNYAQLNNDAVRVAKGDLLVLLNNDTEIVDPQWLRKLAAYAMLPEAGAVGPKLLYGDRTVQHAGVVLGVQGLAAHAHLHLAANDGGYRGLANTTHEVSAVTGACLAVKRTAFEEVGGLNEHFRVAFNDVVFCLDLLDSGRKNIYFAEPLVLHHESKTRGYDDNPEKVRLFRKEARLAWSLQFANLRNDRFYSPNLSVETPYKLAFAPRRRAAWEDARQLPLQVMMLSSTHAQGHGVAVVVDLQARALAERGHSVIIVGPESPNDFKYPGCERVVMLDPRSVASIASERGVDVIVAHTPPFFDVARWTGKYPPVIAYDYGEPPPEFFPDSVLRREGLDSKDLSLRACYKVLAISESVAAESTEPPHGVIPLGNGHLGRWTEASVSRRANVRKAEDWDDKFVILNVCRFHQGERFYKGVDEYAAVRSALDLADPALAARTVFVLCGKGTEEDVAQMRACGLTVRANVTDEEMADLYVAADMYANFSRWEGYNLGIGQALAMGLPVVASDTPAHRAFGVSLAQNTAEAVQAIILQASTKSTRIPRIWEWDAPLSEFVAEIEVTGRRAGIR